MEHDIEDFQMTSERTVESLANDSKTLDIQIKSINDTQRVMSYVLVDLSYGVQGDDRKRTHRRCPAPMRSSFCWVNVALFHLEQKVHVKLSISSHLPGLIPTMSSCLQQMTEIGVCISAYSYQCLLDIVSKPICISGDRSYAGKRKAK